MSNYCKKSLKIFNVSFCLPSAHPSDYKKTSPDIVPVRRPTWCQYTGVNPIQYLHFRAKHFRTERFRAKHFRANLQACPKIINWLFLSSKINWVHGTLVFHLHCIKHRIGLTPLYWPQVGRWTGAISRESFYGRSVRRSEGSRTADGRRQTDGSFYFFLEPPTI